MKKVMLSALAVTGLVLGFNKANAQILEEENVTITMDLQPILQLDMTTADQVDFIFDDVADYAGGIIKYGATQLRVSSSVAWDLYAVAVSQGQQGIANWDQMVPYGIGGVNAVPTIPMSALELRQFPANPAAGANDDYSTNFAPFNQNSAVLNASTNNIFVATGGNPYTRPLAADRYIAGHAGNLAAGEGVPGGSYLLTSDPAGTSSFFYTIDYRIVPGLPATFPFGAPVASGEDHPMFPGGAYNSTYAQPGVYTMNVKYILLEDI
ncbi:MAG: hypothetical protein ACXITV_06505 [Luteibaculaceae bacterium]